jgi:hypothetical protein
MASGSVLSRTEQFMDTIAGLHLKIIKAASRNHQLYLEVFAHINAYAQRPESITEGDIDCIRQALKERKAVIANYVASIVDSNIDKEPNSTKEAKRRNRARDIIRGTATMTRKEDSGLEDMFKQAGLWGIA